MSPNIHLKGMERCQWVFLVLKPRCAIFTTSYGWRNVLTNGTLASLKENLHPDLPERFCWNFFRCHLWGIEEFFEFASQAQCQHKVYCRLRYLFASLAVFLLTVYLCSRDYQSDSFVNDSVLRFLPFTISGSFSCEGSKETCDPVCVIYTISFKSIIYTELGASQTITASITHETQAGSGLILENFTVDTPSASLRLCQVNF